MQLISLEFFLFFALTLFLYNIAPRGARWVILLLASLAFYLLAGIFAFIYILVMSLSSFVLALFMQGRQQEGSGFSLALYIGVLLLLTGWIILKLLAPSGSVVLPLGISFYSLRIISYLVDVKRKRIAAERNFLKYLLFVSYFPLILQGPVARYSEISGRLFSGESATVEGSAAGLLLFMWGVFKKSVIANTLASPIAKIVGGGEKYPGAYVLFLICFYTAEIYCDFSGGIDVIRGASLMLGIELPRNFDRPFSSLSLREFWNRWHISLGEWFEKYVFFPLSLSRPMQRLSRRARARFGSKKGRKIPLYIATMATWLLTGLWHGIRSNFIAWGLINGGLILLSQELAPHLAEFHARYPRIRNKKRLWSALNKMRVFFIIGATRLLDLYGSVGLTFRMLGSIFVNPNSPARLFSELPTIIPTRALAVVLCALGVVYVVGKLNLKADSIAKNPIRCAAAIFSLALLSLVFGTYGIGFDAGDFIYSRF